MIKAEEIKRREKEAYDAVAEVFNAVWARYTGRFAADLIDLMFPQRGEMVLDLAGGTGAAGLKLAERIGNDGRVYIIDLSPAMLHQAERNAAASGVANVITRVMDAENLDFPDSTFDLIICSFGIMFFPHVPRALSEARRVLKPGGRIGFNVWSDPERTPFIALPMKASITRVAPAAVRQLLKVPIIGKRILKRILVSRGSVGPSGLRFSAPGSLERYLARAGFQSIRRERRAYPLEFAGFDDYLEAMTKGTPGGREMAARMPPAIFAEIREELREKLVNPATGRILVYNEAAQVLAKRPA